MLDFGNIFPNVINFMTIGIMATVFIAVAKFIFAKYPIPGLTDVLSSI